MRKEILPRAHSVPRVTLLQSTRTLGFLAATIGTFTQSAQVRICGSVAPELYAQYVPE